MGFEPTIQALEQVKTFHVLDGAATVIGTRRHYETLNDEISKERTTQFSVPLRTVGNLRVLDLATKLISVHKMFT
jgi:hypothetical protein